MHHFLPLPVRCLWSWMKIKFWGMENVPGPQTFILVIFCCDATKLAQRRWLRVELWRVCICPSVKCVKQSHLSFQQGRAGSLSTRFLHSRLSRSCSSCPSVSWVNGLLLASHNGTAAALPSYSSSARPTLSKNKWTWIVIHQLFFGIFVSERPTCM